jgi:mannose-6-phosphate isomerase-like protein (cupin superfamily)
MKALLLAATAAASQPADRLPLVIDERSVLREEPTPHGAIGMSTAYRISDDVPGRTMEFRKRVLHPGAAIGAHRIAHDEVYYVLSGRGVVSSGGREAPIGPGAAAYLYDGQMVGIGQVGKEPLALIVAYPLPAPAR